MYYTVYYTSNGYPIDNLSPIIKIYELVSWDLVSSGTMLNLGDGLYTYEFVDYSLDHEYAVLCDAIVLPHNERYKFLASGEYNNILDSIVGINDNVEIRTSLLRKILTNKLILNDGQIDNYILYDDDSVSELIKWDVRDKNNEDIIGEENYSSRRSKAK